MSSVLSSLPLYFSFLPFFSFFFFPFIFSFSHTSPFLFSLSPSLFSPPFPLQNFKEKWAGIENIRGPSFSSVIHIYVYSHIAYCTTLPVIWKEILRRVWGGEGRKNVDLQKKMVEIFEIHCYVGITREGGGGGGGKEVIFHVPAKYDGVVQQPLSFLQYFSPCFSYFFSFFLFFFFLSFQEK